MGKLIKDILTDVRIKEVEELLFDEFNYSTYRSLDDDAFNKLCKKVAINIVNKLTKTN